MMIPTQNTKNLSKNQSNKPEFNDFGIGRIPPQSIDIEEALLGGMIVEYNKYAPIVFSKIRNSEVMYKNENQIIFSTLQEMYDDGIHVNILTLCERLRSNGTLEAIGGGYAISQLTHKVCSIDSIENYCFILLENHIKRSMIKMASVMVSECYDACNDTFDILDRFEKGMDNINSDISGANTFTSAKHGIELAEQELQKRVEKAKAGEMDGITTGFIGLDSLLYGWQKTDLVILAARPAMGKTAVSLKFVKSAAEAGYSVCMYSLEMGEVSLFNRLILSVCNIDVKRFKSGYMTAFDWSEFNKAKEYLRDLPIYVDANPSVDVRYIKSHSKTMKDKGMCDLIIVDYLQLTEMSDENKMRSREQEVSKTTRNFKRMAKQLDVPVILLSQLNRMLEAGAPTLMNRRPNMAHLRESGAIEQDADIIIFVYRPAYYDIEESDGINFIKYDVDLDGNPYKNGGTAYFIVGKHRNGAVGDVLFDYNESMTHLTDSTQNPFFIPTNNSKTVIEKVINTAKKEQQTIINNHEFELPIYDDCEIDF